MIVYDYMKYSALVPVKTLALAKSRLQDHLSPYQRERLVLDMLEHVIHTLCESEIFEQVYVVSADLKVLEMVQHWDAEPLLETQQGHNPALRAAALTILERAAWREGAFETWARVREQGYVPGHPGESLTRLLPNEGLLTISADLPLLTQKDIQALVRQAKDYQVVLAGSSDGTGTNALLTRPPLALPYLFGPNSLPAYVRAAGQQRLGYTLYQSPNLALDIDTFEDVQKLEQFSRAWSRTASFAL